MGAYLISRVIENWETWPSWYLQTRTTLGERIEWNRKTRCLCSSTTNTEVELLHGFADCFSCCQHYLIVRPQPKYLTTKSTSICGLYLMGLFIQYVFIGCQWCVRHEGGTALTGDQTNVKFSLSSPFCTIFSISSPKLLRI